MYNYVNKSGLLADYANNRVGSLRVLQIGSSMSGVSPTATRCAPLASANNTRVIHHREERHVVARHQMRSPEGRWSLLQLAEAAGITHRRARDLVEAGLLSGEDLRAIDVLRARLGATIIDAVRPSGQTRAASAPIIEARNREALHIATELALNPSSGPEALLVLTPTTVVLHRRSLSAVAALEDATEPSLVVPLGRWITEHRTLLASLTSTTGGGS